MPEMPADLAVQATPLVDLAVAKAPLEPGDDHVVDVVPECQRRGPLTLGLLWITMVTGFPSVLAGFEWYKAGLSVSQVLECAFLSCLIMLAYALPACYVGAASGQTYSLLARHVFGRWGSWLISAVLVVVCALWYALGAVLLAEGLQGLYHWPISTALLACALGVAMAFNNFFGFAGIANFARYIAAPMLIVWVAASFAKACGTCPVAALAEPARAGWGTALMSVSGFVVGYAIWGNEADYWRYSKKKIRCLLPPLVVSLAIGEVLFPLTGWMLARLTGVTEFNAATELMTNYTLGGLSWVAAIVLAVSYFAVNDSGLYGAINGFENLVSLPRRQVVALLTVVSSVMAFFMADFSRAFDVVCLFSSILLPSSTVIVMAEYFLFRTRSQRQNQMHKVVALAALPRLSVPAILALLAAYTVGIATAGIFPQLESLHMGVCSLQGWLAGLAVYCLLRWCEIRRLGSQTDLTISR